jgi:hypothetical protein
MAVVAPDAAPVVQDRLGQRHPAFPVALADHPQHAMSRVDRRDLERGGLADPQAYISVKHALGTGLLTAPRRRRTWASDRACGSRF